MKCNFKFNNTYWIDLNTNQEDYEEGRVSDLEVFDEHFSFRVFYKKYINK
jgi:hypothetical protein